MTKLWHKTGTTVHPMVTNYIISKDLAQDKVLLQYDLQASIAHAEMLAHVGLISKKESGILVKNLEEIAALEKKNKFVLKQENEDCHTAIENYLVEKCGPVGKKIHMGRSRNDQVLVALRLFCKAQLSDIKKAVLQLTEGILAFAQKHEFVPMPGYTHTQQAMPSSVGQWAGAFVESLLDDFKILESAAHLNDQNPLGSAAGFGTNLPIDREYTTQKLHFNRIQSNALYCQNSRGKIESFVVTALLQVMMTLGKIANDLLWFTSSEFSFFTVDQELTTGSSIMPQKHNLDIMEVLRANVSVVMAHQLQIQSVSLNLLSGYNKDLKVTKKAVVESFEITLGSLAITALLFQHMHPNVKRLTEAMTPGIFATDAVNGMTQKGTAFRDAYKHIGENLETVQPQNILKNLKGKKHIGAPGNLGLEKYKEKITETTKRYSKSNTQKTMDD